MLPWLAGSGGASRISPSRSAFFLVRYRLLPATTAVLAATAALGLHSAVGFSRFVGGFTSMPGRCRCMVRSLRGISLSNRGWSSSRHSGHSAGTAIAWRVVPASCRRGAALITLPACPPWRPASSSDVFYCVQGGRQVRFRARRLAPCRFRRPDGV